MKSIKEKADEYAKEYLLSPVAHRAPNIHFEAGANYVLEEIEKTYDKEGLVGVLDLIGQLKK